MEPSDAMLSSERPVNANEGKTETKCIIRQSMTALGPIISTIAAGMVSGYSGILLPQLAPVANATNQSTTSMHMTDHMNMSVLMVTGVEEESWIAASAALAMAPGCWIAGAAMERFGRRGSLLIMSPVFFAGWMMVAFAPSISWLIIGRFICGLCSGYNGPVGPVFIAETSEPRLRGIFLAGISLAIAVGILISQALGIYLHWRLAALLCGLFPAICFVFCMISPESPTWLVKRDKIVKAGKVWTRLRGVYCEQEFDALQASGTKGKEIINGDKKLEKSSATLSSQHNKGRQNASSQNNWKNVVVSAAFYKPLAILIVFFFVSQFAGVNAIASYSIKMFADVAGPENAYTGTLILDIIRVVFSGLACFLTRNYGRRILTIISGIGTVASLMCLSGSLHMKIGEPWLPICFLFGYMCFISIGLVPLPWLLCGELFGSSVRGLGSGLTSSIAFTFFFIVVKAAPGMSESIGAAGTFTCYGVVTFVGTIVLFFYLPETKDKTLAEIEERYTSQTKKTVKKVNEPAPVIY